MNTAYPLFRRRHFSNSQRFKLIMFTVSFATTGQIRQSMRGAPTAKLRLCTQPQPGRILDICIFQAQIAKPEKLLPTPQ
jgi:hypothetical protein